MPKNIKQNTTHSKAINCPGLKSGGIDVACSAAIGFNKNFKTMTTLLLLAAGALSFALFYKTVHYFEKI